MNIRAFLTIVVGIVGSPCCAQEMTFDAVALPMAKDEVVKKIGPQYAAGDRKLFVLEYRSQASAETTRYSLVSVKGKEVEVLFNPYQYHQEPYYTDVKFLKYGSRVVVTVRNPVPLRHSIWITDGTSAGTQELSNEDPGASPSIIRDSLLVSREDRSLRLISLINGASTTIVAAHDGATEGAPNPVTLPDGRALFAYLQSLYVSDGTFAGTQLLAANITGASMRISRYPEAEIQSVRAIVASNTFDGPLAVSDGTVGGTSIVSPSMYASSCPNQVISEGLQLGKRLIFSRCTPAHGSELWVLDLETLTSEQLMDIRPGSAGSGPSRLSRVNNKIFFTADDGEHGRELWVSDGTAEGTRLVRDIAPGGLSSIESDDNIYGEIPPVGQYRIFLASPTGTSGEPTVGLANEVWATDGTEVGTFKVSSTYPANAAYAAQDRDVLIYPVSQDFGIKFAGEDTIGEWQRGIFVKLFDPVLGPPVSSFLATRVGTRELLQIGGSLIAAGDFYYMVGSFSDINTPELLVTRRQLCPGADFKITPGQCGCGVEEIPADSSGGIVDAPERSDGSAVCLTPIGPIFVPKEIPGTVTGDLSQRSGRPDSVQITLPSTVTNALRMVGAAPQQLRGAGTAMRGMGAKVQRGTVLHQVKLILVDGSKKTVKSLILRRGKAGRFKVKLGRRLQKKQRITFQYAVAVSKQSKTYIQTPYVKAGAVKVRKKR
jgi:ELWxxDGT repeat protein